MRKRCIRNFFKHDKIYTPNSLVLHLVVISRDNHVLLTQNNVNKTDDHPGLWAASIGEQLSCKDLAGGNNKWATCLLQRALEEECNIYPDDYSSGDARFVGVTLEADKINFALPCVIKLPLDQSAIMVKLKEMVHKDKEFLNFEFLNINDIPSKLAKDNNPDWHPSTALRLALGFEHIYSRKILHKSKSNNR